MTTVISYYYFGYEDWNTYTLLCYGLVRKELVELVSRDYKTKDHRYFFVASNNLKSENRVRVEGYWKALPVCQEKIIFNNR